LLHAELDSRRGGGPVIVTDSGRRVFEIDSKTACQYYRLISATTVEVQLLRRAGIVLECSDEFEPRQA
jgi:hypothetical protein